MPPRGFFGPVTGIVDRGAVSPSLTTNTASVNDPERPVSRSSSLSMLDQLCVVADGAWARPWATAPRPCCHSTPPSPAMRGQACNACLPQPRAAEGKSAGGARLTRAASRLGSGLHAVSLDEAGQGPSRPVPEDRVEISVIMLMCSGFERRWEMACGERMMDDATWTEFVAERRRGASVEEQRRRMATSAPCWRYSAHHVRTAWAAPLGHLGGFVVGLTGRSLTLCRVS